MSEFFECNPSSLMKEYRNNYFVFLIDRQLQRSRSAHFPLYDFGNVERKRSNYSKTAFVIIIAVSNFMESCRAPADV